jgi:hypothetical protein
MARLAAVFGGVGIIASAAGFAKTPLWYIVGAPGIAFAATFTVIALRYPLTVTLSGTGLTIRDRGVVGVVPASAIEAVGISRIGRVDYVTLWYDSAAVPSLPPAFDRYLRAMPAAIPGKIYPGVIIQPDDAGRISELYRLVQETGLGEWRDHP